MNRVEMLHSFIAQNPKDPFPRYGLAIEHKNAGQLEESRAAFAELIEKFPDYVAGYLHAGGVLVALGKKEEAKAVFRAGIAAAKRKPDAHALGELEGALAELERS